MTNRLTDSLSPYLLQHADNPVDWWPWGEEAFAEAKGRNVPIFLSVGYAACHWCHVMAHESFEDDAVAAQLNAGFVSIKVDREERPDVDAVYMDATQAMTGQGGWPMSVFLTPGGEPFFAGTYFPTPARGGMPSFTEVLDAVADAWEHRRDDVQKASKDIVGKLADRKLPPGSDYTTEVLASAVTKLATEYDPINGGFGGAPKFPPSMVLDFLLRHYKRTGEASALDMARHTADQMAAGGMYDQLGGGFARYSVDTTWTVPHFEKMLYDNALLLDAYTQLAAVANDPTARRIAIETADFLLAELRTPEGGFASSLDADTEGEEGRFYVWTPAELTEVLGEADARWVAELCAVTDVGTFEHGTSVLQLRDQPDDPNRWQRIRTTLREARAKRVRPGRDDKVVAAWNGLAATALVRAGLLFGRPDYVDAAETCLRLLSDVHIDQDGRLYRTSRGGTAGPASGVLEDYGAVAHAAVTLLAVRDDSQWLSTAEQLTARILQDFRADGAFYDTDQQESLLWRPRDPADNASPSGVSLAADALLAVAAVTGSGEHRDAAEQALQGTAVIGVQAPRFAGRALAVAEALQSGPLEVAIAGDARDLVRAAVVHAPWGTPIVAAAPGSTVPLMEGRDLVDGRPAAYVCRNFACERPVTTTADLRAALATH